CPTLDIIPASRNTRTPRRVRPHGIALYNGACGLYTKTTMKRRDFLRAAGFASTAWLPWRRTWAAEQPAVSLTGAAISLAASDIADLASSLQGDLLLPTHSRYEQARRVWNG